MFYATGFEASPNHALRSDTPLVNPFIILV